MIDEIVTAVFNHVSGLGLTIGGVVLPVVKAKQPLTEPPNNDRQVTVHPDEHPETYEQLDTVSDIYTYKVNVTTWVPGKKDSDPAASPDYSAVNDTIVRTINATPDVISTAPGVYDVRAETGTYVDRGSFSKGWDVQQVNVEVQVVRTRAVPPLRSSTLKTEKGEDDGS